MRLLRGLGVAGVVTMMDGHEVRVDGLELEVKSWG
jgi:hypothetical protein